MSSKGKGGKKHRRAKNTIVNNAVLPDETQYFAYVTKILGSGRVNLDYYIPKIDEKSNEILDWEKISKIGVIRGKMMRRVYVNLNDIVLVTERDFDKSKVDIIEKYQMTQISYLKKFSNFPPMNEISNNDIEFDFEYENNNENNNDNDNKTEDYMIGIPSFIVNESDQMDETINTL